MYEDLTVIICCAGTGKRLGIDFPKALLDLNGKPLILNLLDALREVKDVRIVVGFKYKNLINTVTKYRKDVTFCFNRSYASTGPAYSLEQAFVGVNKRILIIDGDVVVDPSVLRKSLNQNNVIFANSSHKEDGIKIVTDVDNKILYFTKTKGSLVYAGVAVVDRDVISFKNNNRYIYECIDCSRGLKVNCVNSIDVNSSVDYSYALKLVKSNYSSKLVIGCLGGMGTYATISFFELYAKIFGAKYESDRPRLIIDNNCSMPSRVRAYLYNEEVESLIDQMTSSLLNLLNSGANKLILACNTSHLFLDRIYEKHPELKEYILNIIEICGDFLKKENITKVYLLGSEAIIESKIYNKIFSKFGIEVESPSNDKFKIIRDCIEAVKQDQYNDEIKKEFLELMNSELPCVLGCTELPILCNRYKSEIKNKIIFDPLEISLRHLKEKCY